MVRVSPSPTKGGFWGMDSYCKLPSVIRSGIPAINVIFCSENASSSSKVYHFGIENCYELIFKIDHLIPII